MKIEVDRACKKIGERKIFSDISFSADNGSMMALVGASGSGKTTLLNCLGLLLPLTSGSITLGGAESQQISRSARLKLWHSSISFVFQDFGLIDDETVVRNIILGDAPILGKPSKRLGEAAEEALAAVGLGGRGADAVTKLSGGERQRVGIARALYKKAKLILADEPTASLDRANREHMQQLLRHAAAAGATVVVATHDDELAASCDKAIRLG